MLKDTIVYINSNTCNWHLNEIDESISRTYNFDKFVTNACAKKISMLHVPFPYTENFEELVNRCVTNSNQVIILCSELHVSTVDFISKVAHPKIKYFINGFIDNIPANQWLDWFITSTDFYKSSTVLSQLNPFAAKEKYFDVLLGQQRIHRDIIYSGISNLRLTDCVALSYITNRSIPLTQHPDWIWEMPGLSLPKHHFNHTVTMVNYYGYEMRLSQIIPIQVYNQTAYSLVAETNCDNYYSFFTEKIVKPILARRLFIVFSGCNYLKNLRSLGFRTFDSIIDESYDTVTNLQVRGKLILEQMQYLIKQDQKAVLKLVQPIAEHNYQVMMETNWLRNCTNQISWLMQTG